MEITLFYLLFGLLNAHSYEEVCSKFSVKNPSQKKHLYGAEKVSSENYNFKNQITGEKFEWKIEINSTDRKLGNGTFGNVFKIRCPEKVDSKQEVAIKQIALFDLYNLPPLIDLELKVNLEMNDSGYTPNTYGCVYDKNTNKDPTVYFVQEVMEGSMGNLDFRKAIKKYSTANQLKMILQLVKGLLKLKSVGYIHNDIKPENILFRKDATTGLYNLKIIDFGVIQKKGTKRTMMGSPLYCAPSKLSTLSTLAEDKDDAYSLAITLGQVFAEGVDDLFLDSKKKFLPEWCFKTNLSKKSCQETMKANAITIFEKYFGKYQEKLSATDKPNLTTLICNLISYHDLKGFTLETFKTQIENIINALPRSDVLPPKPGKKIYTESEEEDFGKKASDEISKMKKQVVYLHAQIQQEKLTLQENVKKVNDKVTIRVLRYENAKLQISELEKNSNKLVNQLESEMIELLNKIKSAEEKLDALQHKDFLESRMYEVEQNLMKGGTQFPGFSEETGDSELLPPIKVKQDPFAFKKPEKQDFVKKDDRFNHFRLPAVDVKPQKIDPFGKKEPEKIGYGKKEPAYVPQLAKPLLEREEVKVVHHNPLGFNYGAGFPPAGKRRFQI